MTPAKDVLKQPSEGLSLSPLTSVGRAARRLGISVTTVQRLCDSGTIQFEKTAGGHRRISLAEIDRLASSNERHTAKQKDPLVSALLSGDARYILAALKARRAESLSWAEVGDQVASALASVGELWAAGDCLIFEEHVASEALRRALIEQIQSMRRKIGARKAMLLTPIGERHTMPLLMGELVVAECDWQSRWLGEGPPTKELKLGLERLSPDLVVVAATKVYSEVQLHRYQAHILAASESTRTPVVLAGAALWKEDGRATRVSSFQQFRQVLL